MINISELPTLTLKEYLTFLSRNAKAVERLCLSNEQNTTISKEPETKECGSRSRNDGNIESNRPLVDGMLAKPLMHGRPYTVTWLHPAGQ